MSEEMVLSDVKAVELHENKRNVRKEVWDMMETQDVLLHYRPIYRRVPDFKGSELCLNKLMELDEVKQAKFIYSDIDKPLLPCIQHLLKEKKSVLIPELRSGFGFLRKLVDQENNSKGSPSNSIKLMQMYKGSTVVAYNKVPHIDLLIVSSVVVSSSGHRMGSDTVLSRRLYPLFSTVGAVDASTTIITLVHDLQVVQFSDDETTHYHVPADIVVTPTQLFRATGKPDCHQRDTVLDWSTVPDDIVQRYLWLQKIKAGDMSDIVVDEKRGGNMETGADKALNGTSGVAKNSEGRQRHSRRTYRSSKKSGDMEDVTESQASTRKPQRISSKAEKGTRQENGDSSTMMNGGSDTDGKAMSKTAHGGERKRRRRRNRDREWKTNSDAEAELSEKVEALGSEDDGSRRRRSYKEKLYKTDMPMLYIGGFVRMLRYWEVKRMVRDCGVHPYYMVRKPYTSYAFLYFKSEDDLKTAQDQLQVLQRPDTMIRVEVGKTKKGKSRKHKEESKSGEEDEVVNKNQEESGSTIGSRSEETVASSSDDNVQHKQLPEEKNGAAESSSCEQQQLHEKQEQQTEQNGVQQGLSDMKEGIGSVAQPEVAVQ